MKSTGYLRVWKTEVRDNIVIADLGDSKKDKEGKYENWTWFRSAFVGGAKKKAESLNEKDLINVTEGQISMRKADDGKYYPNLVIFDFEEVTDAGNGNGKSGGEAKKSEGKKKAKKPAPQPEPELDDDEDEDEDDEELPF